jgi:hypothetical protein
MPTVISDLHPPGNAKYPDIANDFTYTFAAMKKLTFDIWLAGHASQCDIHTKNAAGKGYHPESFAGRKDYDEALTDLEKQFERKLKKVD